MHGNSSSESTQLAAVRDTRDSPGGGFYLSKQTLDKLLGHKSGRGADMIALLVFYHYTALWQASDQPHATVAFVAKGLHWGLDKAREIRNLLKEAGSSKT